MSDLIIHHVNISYDESDERVRNFIQYLNSDSRKDLMMFYYKEAMKESSHSLSLNDKDGNDFTLVCSDGFNCTLSLRGM